MSGDDWWKNALGTKTNNAVQFQDLIESAPKNTYIVVDFFMPRCGYCVKFMDNWNQIVEEFTSQYGDQIMFVKVDGTQDSYTAARYGVHSYPTFIMIEPGTQGDDWERWNPNKRDYAGMKRWINSIVGDNLKSISAVPSGDNALAMAAGNLSNDWHLNTALPIADGSANSAYFAAQAEENKHMAESISTMMIQQQEMAKHTKELQESMDSMMTTQEDIQTQLAPALDSAGSSSFTVFMAGIVIGIIAGLFFASYLVQMGRMGAKKGAKGQGARNGSNPPGKEFSQIVKKDGNGGATQRSAGHQSGGSDHNDESSSFI